MTVHALRRTIGDPAFFALLKSWPAEHRDGNVRTEDFRGRRGAGGPARTSATSSRRGCSAR
jgi:hypothetical protein